MPERATAEASARILIISRHYAPEPVGSGPVIQAMAEWLAARGWLVEVVTVRPNYPGRSIFDGYRSGERDHTIEGGLRVLRLPTWPSGGGIRQRLLAELRFLLDLIWLRFGHRVKPADTVISLCPSILAVLGATLFRRRDGQHIAIVHDIPSRLGRAIGLGGAGLAGLAGMIERWAFNRTDRLVVLSGAMERALLEMGVTKPMLVQPPPLDTAALRPLPRRQDGVPVALYSGNLGRKQGLGQLLDAAAVLQRTAPSIRIEIRGDGQVKDSLMARAASEQLTNLRFQPLAPKHRLSETLAEADIHLIPQIPGGADFAVPSKAYTIMAAGRPFIATAKPGSPLAELAAQSGAGLCVPPHDAAALAGAIAKLAANPLDQQRMGMLGRRYVEKVADINAVMTAITAAICPAQLVREAAE